MRDARWLRTRVVCAGSDSDVCFQSPCLASPFFPVHTMEFPTFIHGKKYVLSEAFINSSCQSDPTVQSCPRCRVYCSCSSSWDERHHSHVSKVLLIQNGSSLVCYLSPHPSDQAVSSTLLTKVAPSSNPPVGCHCPLPPPTSITFSSPRISSHHVVAMRCAFRAISSARSR